MNDKKESEFGLTGKTDPLELAKALEHCSLVANINQKLEEITKMKEEVSSFNLLEGYRSKSSCRQVLYSEEINMWAVCQPEDMSPVVAVLDLLEISYVSRANKGNTICPADFFLDLTLSGHPKDKKPDEEQAETLSFTFRIANTKDSWDDNIGLLTQTTERNIMRGDGCQVNCVKEKDFRQVMDTCYSWIKKFNESLDQDKQLEIHINAPIITFD